MSSPLRIHIIAEGETDKIVLDAFIEAILGHANFVSTLIQPETSQAFGHAGPHGGGWKGVRKKCQEIGARGGPLAGGYLANTDLLVVHLDGEVADEDEVACAKPCPPPSDTVTALHERVREWMGIDVYPRVIIAIPMKETEAWVFAALRPDDKLLGDDRCFECRDKPSALLSGGSPRLIRSGKKHKSSYRAVERELVAGFASPVRLSQMQRFEDDFKAGCAMWHLGATQV